MREWYALEAIARFREMHPDATSAEEDAIFEHHMSDSPSALFLRCEFSSSGVGFMPDIGRRGILISVKW